MRAGDETDWTRVGGTALVTTDHEAAPSRPEPTEAAPADAARLRVLTGPAAGRTCMVGRVTVLGRADEADLVLEGSAVSRLHARIRHVGPRAFAVEDLGSRNGTWLNGLRVGKEPTPLQFGDKLEVGGTVLLFSHFDPGEERLQQAHKLQALGQLAGGIAHDVNNLAGAALMNIRHMRKRPGRDEDDAECLKDCEEALGRVSQLVQRLLTFSRREQAVAEPVELAPLVDEAWRVIRHRRGSAIALRVDIPAVLAVRGDSAQLLQVLTNLLANAADAMPGGGTLSVRAHATRFSAAAVSPSSDRCVRLIVADTGCGIPAAVLPHLFEPFFTTKATGQGTGLGLATVHQIVTGHGGTIRAESVPGKGTTFIVELPEAPGA